MAKAEATSTTSRRALLGAMPALAVGGALVAPAVAQDPHAEWLIVIEECWRQMDEAPLPGLPDLVMDRLNHEIARCQERIAETVAHSDEGVICQIKVGYHAADGLADPETGMQALDNAIAALKARAGRA